MLKQELPRAIIENCWWGKLKDRIRYFAADYSRRLKLDMVAEQRVVESKLDWVVWAGDCREVRIAKAELASSQSKMYQALVVKARLKRMSCEATNMAQELQVEELRCAVDIHITSVTSSDGQRRTTNEAICKEFQVSFEKLFTRESGLPNFHRLSGQTLRCDATLCVSASKTGCVHKTTRQGASGKKTPDYPSRRWEVCTRPMERPTACPKASVPSIVSVGLS